MTEKIGLANILNSLCFLQQDFYILNSQKQTFTFGDTNDDNAHSAEQVLWVMSFRLKIILCYIYSIKIWKYRWDHFMRKITGLFKQ